MFTASCSEFYNSQDIPEYSQIELDVHITEHSVECDETYFIIPVGIVNASVHVYKKQTWCHIAVAYWFVCAAFCKKKHPNVLPYIILGSKDMFPTYRQEAVFVLYQYPRYCRARSLDTFAARNPWRVISKQRLHSRERLDMKRTPYLLHMHVQRSAVCSTGMTCCCCMDSAQ